MENKENTQIIEEQTQEVEHEEIIQEEIKEEVQEDPKPVEEPKPDRNKLLRELSKEYGVNLFDAEGIEEFKKYQETKLSELEKTQKQLEEYKQREDQYKQELEKARLDSLRIQYNLDEDKFEDFLVLAKAQMTEDTTAEEAFKNTLNRYGDVFTSKKQKEQVRLGIQVDNTNPINEEVKSFDQAVLEAWFKNRK